MNQKYCSREGSQKYRKVTAVHKPLKFGYLIRVEHLKKILHKDWNCRTLYGTMNIRGYYL